MANEIRDDFFPVQSSTMVGSHLSLILEENLAVEAETLS